jgi:hypothetical protein
MASDPTPIQISVLNKWISSSTQSWLDQAKKVEYARREEDANYGADLFITQQDREEEFELLHCRVRRWMTSKTNPDGIFDWSYEEAPNTPNSTEECCGISVIYIISDSSEGHGNSLWPSSRHVSNLLANEQSCRQVLQPLLEQKQIDTTQKHPLLGLNFLELGSGAGVPSWTAMKCGARVVCTDQRVPDRIRCIAECIERNWRDMQLAVRDGDVLQNAEMARACPYNWGEPIDEITAFLGKDERFDVVVAADCCYMPLLQGKLLQSIDMLLSKEGVALVPFALHGNAKDEDVWGIVDRAKEIGFCVEVLESKQLSMLTIGMDKSRGLVHTVRLTRQKC